jgi:predicted CXXCH cytochrome family protein
MIQYLTFRYEKYDPRIRNLFLYVFSLWIMLILCPYDASAEIYGCYMGAQTCNECHTETVDNWRQTGHASAFSSLEKSGQQDLPDCLRCHVVGYGRSGGFLGPELTMELAGVQCESCHGPGKSHSDEPDALNIVSMPGEEVCRTCHTIGQAPNFDYQKKISFVHKKAESNIPHQPIASQTSSVDSTLLIEKTRIELALVEEGTPAIAYIKIKNNGKETINITDVISA